MFIQNFPPLKEKFHFSYSFSLHREITFLIFHRLQFLRHFVSSIAY